MVSWYFKVHFKNCISRYKTKLNKCWENKICILVLTRAQVVNSMSKDDLIKKRQKLLIKHSLKKVLTEHRELSGPMNLHDCVRWKISGLHPKGFISLRVGKWKYSDQELSKATVDIIHIQTEVFHDQISRVLIKCLHQAKEPATLRSEPSALAGVKWVKWRSESLKLPTALGCQAAYLYILAVYFKT